MILRCPLLLSAPALFVMAATCGPMVAQTPGPVRVTRSSPAVMPVTLPAGEVATSGAVQAPQNPAAPPAANDPAAVERLNKWKQTLFDRRRSTMLQAWASPELKPYDPAEDAPKLSTEVRDLVKEQFGVDPGGVWDSQGGELRAVRA